MHFDFLNIFSLLQNYRKLSAMELFWPKCSCIYTYRIVIISIFVDWEKIIYERIDLK